MDEIFSWFLAILVLLAYLIPKIVGFLFTVATIGSAIWALADIPVFMGMNGKINRGYKVSSKPLSNELKQYLNDLSDGIVEHRAVSFGNDISAFIRKQDGEVLINAKQSYVLRSRRSWPFVGYVNLLSSDPVLEYRSSLPFLLFLVSLSLSIVLIPFIAVMYAFSYSVETHEIEKFLQSKVASSTSKKIGISS